jgi:hypothetical protein
VDIAEQEDATTGHVANLAKHGINRFGSQVVRDTFPDKTGGAHSIKTSLAQDFAKGLSVEVDGKESHVVWQNSDFFLQSNLFGKRCLRLIQFERG